MKATPCLLLTIFWITSLNAQTPATADGSGMKAGDIAKKWQTAPPAASASPDLPGGPRTRGIRTRGATASAPPTPILRTRGAGLSQTAVDANADSLENLRRRGMNILKGADAAAAQAAQDQAGGDTTDARKKMVSAASPPAYVEVPVVVEKQISFRLRFKKDSTELADAESASLVSVIAAAMKELPDAIFLLEGHTCDLGEDDHNQRLSEDRSLRVRTLLGDMGIPSSRLLSVGQGESQCEVANTSDENRALNRRVVIGPIELPKQL